VTTVLFGLFVPTVPGGVEFMDGNYGRQRKKTGAHYLETISHQMSTDLDENLVQA